MRENVQYNKFYKTLNEFSRAIEDFFVDKINYIGLKIKSIINDNFQEFQPNLILNTT